MAAIPWMPLYIADYLADTGHLGTIDHGAYFLLIMHYWTKGPLPADDGQLRKIARMTSREWSDARGVLLDFFKLDGAVYRHERIEAELAEAAKLIDAKSKAGQAGAKKRWQAHSKQNSTPINTRIAEPLADAPQTQCDRGAHLPTPSPEEERRDDDLPASLDRIKATLLRICERLGVKYGADPQQIVWLNVVTEMFRDGIPEQDILRAADITRTKGFKNINYVRTVAVSLAQEKTQHERSGKPARESVHTAWSRAGAELIAEYEAGDNGGNHHDPHGSGPQLLAAGHDTGREENSAAPDVRGPRH